MIFRLATCLFATAIALPGFAAAPLPPLTPAEKSLFWGSAEDAVPEVRHAYKKENEGQHFLYCDELHLELFEPYLRDIGGGYVGVGTDQAYLFIGWMRPQLAWLTDYDPLVGTMHKVYRALLAEAETPQAFLALWRDRKAALAVLHRRAEADVDLPKMLKVFEQQQYYALRRLEYLAKPMIGKTKARTFVNDADDYAYVRALVTGGRVRALLGNLLADKGISGVGEAARKLHVPIRAMYVSNAEQYWKFSDAYRKNIASLPFDAQSWLVRSQASKPSNHDYRYYLQAGTQFATQLADPKVTAVYQAVPFVAIDDPTTAPLIVIAADGKKTLKWTKPPVKPPVAPVVEKAP